MKIVIAEDGIFFEGIPVSKDNDEVTQEEQNDAALNAINWAFGALAMVAINIKHGRAELAVAQRIATGAMEQIQAGMH